MSGGHGNAYLCHVAGFLLEKTLSKLKLNDIFHTLKQACHHIDFSFFSMAACMQKYAEIVAVMMSDAIPLLCLMEVHSKGGAKNK